MLAGVINDGILLSEANQDADITLEDVPRNMTEEGDELTIQWEENVEASLVYSTGIEGGELQDPQPVEDPLRAGAGFVTVRGNQLPVGVLFCLIVAPNGDHSIIFNIIRVAGDAPEMIAPITAERREGIREVTPSIRWESVAGVPFYHVIVSDQPFVITQDEEGTRVEGANVIWQAITSQTSILYGIPDPSDFFENANVPPLVGSMDRDDRPRYAWVVLNNYGNHPAYTSTVTGGVSGFEVEVEPPFAESENIAPQTRAVIGDDEIIFRWTQIPQAISYFIYANREEITPGGSRALIPAWNAQTTLTSIACPAGDVLLEGRYVWKVLAASQQGRGTYSDTTSFTYVTESGDVTFRSRTEDGNNLEFVEVSVDPIDGAGVNPFSTDDSGFHQRPIPVGTYRFHGLKAGYEETVSDVIEVVADEEATVDLELSPLPSNIVGSVISGEDNAIQGARVTARNVRTGSEVNTETNIAGRYHLIVEPGDWAVSAAARGHHPADEVVVQVELGQSVDVDAEHGEFVLQHYRFTISGIVRNPARQPINLATVTLTSAEGAVTRAYTPESGTYAFTVGQGDWVVNAAKPGFYLESGAVQVSINDRDRELNFTLVPQAGIVSGIVRVDGNPGNRIATVWFIPDAGDVTITNINQIGGYSQGLSPGNYMITPVRAGYHAVDTVQISVGPGETISGVRLDLEANPSSIAGRIIDDNNQPLRDADVSAAGVTVRTDANGAYRLVVAAGNHTVTASKNGYVTNQRGPVTVRAGENLAGINLTLVNNAGTILGRVRRGNDPIFDAVVTATNLNTNAAFQARTNREGRYSFGLTFGSYRLTVQRDGFIPVAPGRIDVQLQPGQEVSGRDFAMLNYSSRVAGAVSSPAGVVTSPSIRMVQLGNPDRSFQTTGNVQGGYSLTVPPEERYIVTASKPGYQAARDTTDVLQVEGDIEVNFRLDPLPCQLTGTAFSGDTRLPDVTVRADGDGRVYQSVTDRAGNFRLDLEPGSYNLTASRPGYVSDEDAARLSPGEARGGFRFDLAENFSRLGGRALGPEDNPIEAATVFLVDSLSGRSQSQVSDEDGAYLFQNIIPGVYRLRSEHPRYAAAARRIGPIVGGQNLQAQNLSMTPLNALIVGRVLAGGQALGDVTVYATSEDGQFTALSNNQGNYAIANLHAGTYDLRPARVGYTGLVEEDARLGPGDTLTVDLEMVRNDGRITGNVRDPDDAGLRDVQITAVDSLGNFAAARTNPAGQFAILNLYPRTRYSVSVRLAGYAADNDTVHNVAAGAVVNFTLTPNELRISGRVVNQDGTRIPSTDVSAVSLADGSAFYTTADTAANYRLSGLARNTRYRIRTHRHDDIYTNVDQAVETEDNHLEGVNLTIVERSASISGGVAVVEATVTARNRATGTVVTGYSAPDGSYQLLRLRNGDWVVRAAKIGFIVNPDSIVARELRLGEQRGDVNFTFQEVRFNISGRVTDAADQPVVAAPVLGWCPAGQFRDTTDQNGDYRLTRVFRNQTYQLTTVLPNEGYDNPAVELRVENADRSGINLRVIRHNAVLTGLVSLPDGSPAPGANVLLGGQRQALTDAEGLFVFRYVAAGEHTLALSRPGYAPQVHTVNAGNGEGQFDYRFTLHPLDNAIFGAVKYAPDRSPLNDCVMSLADDRGDTFYDTTDTGGSFNFNRLDPERTYRLQPVKKGYTTITRTDISVREGSQELNFDLSRTPNTVIGTFKTSAGGKLSAARIILQSFAGAITYDTTNFAGDYAISADAGSYMLLGEILHFVQNDTMRTSYNHNIALAQNQSVFKPLVLRDAGVIAGSLIDDNRNPPASAGYVLTRHTATGDIAFNWSTQQGAFMLRGMRPGAHRVTVEASGYAMLAGAVNATVNPNDTTRLVIPLTQIGKAINGYVFDQHADPVVRARVTLDGPTPADLLTTEDGYFTIDAPDPGDYVVHLERAGYATPSDTAFHIEPGEILTITLTMDLIPSAISGRIIDDSGILREGIMAHLLRGSDPIDSTSSDEFGDYLFRDVSGGTYLITLAREGFRSQPDTAEILHFVQNDSRLDVNFLLLPDRGFGTVDGIVLHRGGPVAGALVGLRDINTGLRVSETAGADGEFHFSRAPAPATYRLRATVGAQLVAPVPAADPFFLEIDSSHTDSLVFPAGQIAVRLLNINGNPILGRRVSATGITVRFDTLLYTDANGRAATDPWLPPGNYSLRPDEARGSLPPEPKIVTLLRDEEVSLEWSLGWVLTPPPPFSFQDSARVQIEIPSLVSVIDSVSKLYWRGPADIEFHPAPLWREGGGLEGAKIHHRDTEAQRNPYFRASVSRGPEPITDGGGLEGAGWSRRITARPEPMSSDQGVIYFGLIPPQRRPGTLAYYLEVHTREGFVFGGPGTVREVTITAEGLLDYLELAPADIASTQIGVPVKLRVSAFDDAGTDLTPALPASAFSWSELDQSRGELTVQPDSAFVAIYKPAETGFVRIRVSILQAFSQVTVVKIAQWVNRNQALEELKIEIPELAQVDKEVASGSSVKLTVSPLDTAGASMQINPLWATEPDILGRMEPVPYSHHAYYRTEPGVIGMARIAVQDSATGIIGRFNEDPHNIPEPADRGLPVYGRLRDAPDTSLFVDGEGFRAMIPPHSVAAGREAGLILKRPDLPSIMRLTAKYQAPTMSYKLVVKEPTERTVIPGSGFRLTLPIPEGFKMTEPLVGRWDNDKLEWTPLRGAFVDDGRSVEVEVDRLRGRYTLLAESKPLGISDIRFNPNPFSPGRGGCEFEFQLDSNQDTHPVVTIKIFNMAGQHIRTLLQGELIGKGLHSRQSNLEHVVWDGLTDSGRMARNGRYVVVFEARDSDGEVKKVDTVVLIK